MRQKDDGRASISWSLRSLCDNQLYRCRVWVHADFKSCASATSIMGYGTLASACVKQKLNAKRSTEDELVGAAD